MKIAVSALALLLVIGSAPAIAVNCTASTGYHRLDDAQVKALLNQGVACYPSGGPPWQNQEYHTGVATAASGNVIDYKKGPSDPRDPSKQVGTYAIVATGAGGEITYTYTPGGPFAYKIFGATTSGTGNYDFCLNGTTLLPHQVHVIVGTGTPVAC